MRTPTLGYEDNTAISKLEIAKVQLEEAIELFVSEKFLCALTLSGASEGVLSGLLEAQGQASAVEESAEAILNIARLKDLAGLANVTNKQMFRDWNAARNLAKHHNAKENETIVLNIFDEAYWMIRRALANAKKLNLEIRNVNEFENWIIININM